VQLLWFLPSLAYGLMLAVSTQNYFLLASSSFTILVALLVRWRLARRPRLSAQTNLRIIGKHIWLDDYRLPRGEIFWTREQADFVFERLANGGATMQTQRDFCASSYEPSDRPLAFALGFNQREILQRSLVDDGPHAIFVGSTGSGKTQLLRAALAAIVTPKNEVALVCIDFKGGAGLARFERNSIEFSSDHDLQHAANVIDALDRELGMRELGQKPLLPMIIAIDELAHLLAKVKRANEVLTSIAARGRSAQMHLMMTNQNLVGISRALLSNVNLRVLIGRPDPVDASTLGSSAKASDFASLPSQSPFAIAQVLGHGQSGEAFSFVLTEAIEPKPAREPSSREPRQRQRSAADLREYSNQGRGRHRLRRQPAIRGLLSRAHMAASR
jgi:S-DNA-T family DNA segregation ATPase FtsK/SpoIIIE